MSEWVWVYDNFRKNWPDADRKLYCKTSKGYCIGHTNSDSVVSFDKFEKKSRKDKPLIFLQYKYISEEQYNFLKYLKD